MSSTLQEELDRAQLIELSRRLTELEREFGLTRDLLRQMIERIDELERETP